MYYKELPNCHRLCTGRVCVPDRQDLWDMRVALNSIPADRLREILINHASPTDPQTG